MDTQRIDELITKGQEVLKTYYHQPGTIGFPDLNHGSYSRWRVQVLTYVISVVNKDSSYHQSIQGALKDKAYSSYVQTGLGILKGLKEDIEAGRIISLVKALTMKPIDKLLTLLERFHLVTRQLRVRHDSRDTLDISDEYDVQDLLHALLRIGYDDIRAEEWCPSYAGKSSRMDFLLQDFDIVIEVKKTRVGLSGKEIGTQLIEDIARYQRHPNCKTLVCFVYDPEGRIGNPKGIETDLSRQIGDVEVKVIIRPR